MHRPGHYGASLVGYAPFASVLIALEYSVFALIGLGIALGVAMVPDWDQRIPLITHRGITHTVWAALTIGGVIGVVALGVFGSLIAAVTCGIAATLSILSHITADACTRMGVRPFAPIVRTQYKIPFYVLPFIRNPRADSLIANYLLLGLGIVATAAAITLGVWLQSLPPETITVPW